MSHYLPVGQRSRYNGDEYSTQVEARAYDCSSCGFVAHQIELCDNRIVASTSVLPFRSWKVASSRIVPGEGFVVEGFAEDACQVGDGAVAPPCRIVEDEVAQHSLVTRGQDQVHRQELQQDLEAATPFGALQADLDV